MNNLKQAIAALKLSEQSCRDEASGKLDDSHNLAEGMAAIVPKIKELSYLKFGRDRAEVEDEIMARYKSGT